MSLIQTIAVELKLKRLSKLNGDEALAVARTRHHDSDLKRGERQMDLIKLLFQKLRVLIHMTN